MTFFSFSSKTNLKNIFFMVLMVGIVGTMTVFSISDAHAEDPPSFILEWGSFGTGDGQLNNPWGIAVDAFDNVYVADNYNNRIQKFDSNGNYILQFSNGFNSPFGMAFDSSNNLYVADENNQRVQKFDSNGNFILLWNVGGPGTTWDVAVDPLDNVYVAARGTASDGTIKKYDVNGNFISQWGVGPHLANTVATDLSGNVYVGLSGNSGIQKFDSNGNPLLLFGNGVIQNPLGMNIDSSGNVYVAEQGLHRVEKYSGSGTLLASWGTHGSGEGQFDLPHGAAIDSSGNVYVADRNNHRIQKFGDPLPPTSGSQATGTTTILGTCGISFPDGNTVNYGALVPSTLSPEVQLNMTNSGSVNATLFVAGNNWEDGSNNDVMYANVTHYNATTPGNGYANNADLEPFDQTVTASFAPAVILETYWQILADLINPSFTGSATQTMDFTVSC